MKRYSVDTPSDEASFISDFFKRDKDKSWDCILTQSKNSRSDKQNRLSHVLYASIERQGCEYTIAQAKNMSKYYCGLGIIIAEEPIISKTYRKALELHSVEDRIEIMSLLPVTSLFGVTQMAHYLERVYIFWEESGAYSLPRPEDLYYESIFVKH
tara:strand:- start:281 stop:745 length:465 start_codon:yes stop_codon:yes gene_type:complete